MLYYGLVFSPLFIFLYGGVLMMLITLGVFCGLVHLPIFIAKTRNIPIADITVVKILSWVGLIIHITWVVALLIACFREPAAVLIQKDGK